MDNITGVTRTYNPFQLEMIDLDEEDILGEESVDEDIDPETVVPNAASAASAASDNDASKSANKEVNKEAQQLLDGYKKQVTSIYSSSITKSDSFPANIQTLITKMKTSYCNKDIISLDVEKSKKQINSIMNEFYENVGALTAANCVKAISKMSTALQYAMSHTDNWLKAKLINDESNNPVTSDEYGQKRKEFKEFFNDILTNLNNALAHISAGSYKDPKTINIENASDVNSIPTDYSDTLAVLKAALGPDADSILNFENGSIEKNFKKIKEKIDDLLTDDYVKLLNGSTETVQEEEAITQQIRELNYLLQLYNLPTNVSKSQTQAMTESVKTFNSNPSDANYYKVGETVVTVDKQNIDYQDEIHDDLEKIFSVLSRAIGEGDDHSPSDSEYEDTALEINEQSYKDGIAKTGSTPGSKLRAQIMEDIVSIKNRGEFQDVELATMLQRELKAITSAQQLELKKFEEEYFKYDKETGEGVGIIAKLNDQLKDLRNEYKDAIEAWNKYFYDERGKIEGSVSGSWSGETSGSLSGKIKGDIPIEDTVEYDKLKTKYEIQIADLEKQIKEKTDKYESDVKRMKEIFEGESRDIIEALSKLGVVTAITTAV